MFEKPHSRSSVRLLLWISFYIVFSSGTQAAEPLPVDDKATQIQKEVSNRVLKLADGLDSFFGNDRVEDDAQRTRVKLRLDFDKAESEEFDAKARLSARISLPRLENKWSVIISGDDDEDDDSDLEEDKDRSLALRYDRKNTRKTNLSFDVGLKRPDNSYEVFGRARYRITIPRERWVTRFDNKLFAYSSFGLEYDGKLEFDRALPPSLLFRSKTRLRWWENDKKCNGGVCPEQHFILYQRMKSPVHALSYEASAFFQSNPSDDSNDYLSLGRLLLRYRHRTPWDWAFVEFRPSVSFPRDNDYAPNWGILIRLEAIFGYKPKYDSLEFGPEQNIKGS